jgi:dTMP kinase
MKRGKFIVFEGIEGSGKSYQSKAFYNHLLKNGEDVVLTSEPWEDDDTGKLIRKELKVKKDAISVRTLQFLYIANRSNHVEKFIVPNIESGKTVICDRYWMSTVSYGSTFTKGPESKLDYFLDINSIFLKPDAVFYMDVEPSEAHRRISDRNSTKERFDKLEYLKLLRRKYNAIEEIYKGRWIRIDSGREMDAVTSDIIKKYYSL